jgi:hypothetical protein
MAEFPVTASVESVGAMTTKLASLQEALKEFKKGAKGEKSKKVADSTDKSAAEFTAEIASLKKEIKAREKLGDADIKNIDKFIFDESREKIKTLFLIHHTMKETAVDCQLLHKFHGDDSIHCSLEIKEREKQQQPEGDKPTEKKYHKKDKNV